MKNLLCSQSSYPTSSLYQQPTAADPLLHHSSFKHVAANKNLSRGQEIKTGRHKDPQHRLEKMPEYSAREEIKADELFSCVGELNRNLDSLLTTKASKYITLAYEGKKCSILTKRVVLPSGRQIYVGNLDHKMMVSDGEFYHLEQPLAGRSGFFSSLMLAWAHGSMAFHGFAAPPATGEADSGTPGAQNPPFDVNAWLSTYGGPGGAHPWYSPFYAVWKTMISRPVEILFKAFALPGAHAQQTQSDPGGFFEEDWPNEIKDLINDEIAPVLVTGGCHPSRADHIGDQYFVTSRPLNFMIDGKKTVLSLPHHDAQSEFEHWVSVFSLGNPHPADSLDTLLAFDQYIGEKVQDMFNKGTVYLKEKIHIHLMLLKGELEKIINGCLARNEISNLTQNTIKKYAKDQIKLSRFIKNEAIEFNTVFSESEMEKIYETVEYKRGVTFEDARNILHSLYLDADYEEKVKYVNYYKILIIMEEAKVDYCNELTAIPNSSAIDRTLYKNDMQIMEALLQDKNEKINNLVKKRIFYSIYEFTRSNGISLQSENILMPGELTKYNALFDEPEYEIQEDEILNIFSSELTNYLSLRTEHGAALLNTLKVIELIRANADIDVNEHPWYEINILPFNMTKKLYLDIISASQDQKTHIALPMTWHDDYKTQLFKDKVSYINADILISLQLDFNNVLLDILTYEKNIVAESEEQRIIEAKLAAIAHCFPTISQKNDYDSHLIHYKNSVTLGDISVLITAAAYWYSSSINKENVPFTLQDAHFLTISRHFIEQEQSIAAELAIPDDKRFLSVYQLNPSSEFDDKRDYYNQFIEYKMNAINLEAKYKTAFAIKLSSIGYYDLAYYPEEAYTFKVYSRKYIQNTLAHSPSVLSPVANLGFISIVKTKTQRLVLISTLADSAYIRVVTELTDNPFISNLMGEWKNASDRLETRSHKKFEVAMSDLHRLFFSGEQSSHGDHPTLDLILVKPQENDYSNPAPEITFAAVKDMDAKQDLRSFIDTLNYKTLLEICTGLKYALLRPTWIDFITMHIPFYHVLENYWYDAEMTVKFEDVIFDLFELIITLIPTGLVMSKLPKSYISIILISAKSQNIPKELLKRFFILEFSKISPSVSQLLAQRVSSDLLQFINPLPFSLQTTFSLPMKCYKNIKNNIRFVNTWMNTQKKIQAHLRKHWSINPPPEKLKLHLDGTYIESEKGDSARHFIKDRNDIFLVQRDEDNKFWRVLDPNTSDNMNNAIAVAPHGANLWEINPVDVKIESSFFSYLAPGVAAKTRVPEIKFEALSPVPLNINLEDNFTENHLKILTFFLTENEYYINELLSAQFSKHSILLALSDRLTGHVSKNQVFSGAGYTPRQNELIDEFYALSGKFDINVNFRAINFWIDRFDFNPINHVLIKYTIGQNIYIIDPLTLRPPHNLNPSTKQVYLENHWLRRYKKYLPEKLTLVKYKDYLNIEDAILFSQDKYLSPSQIIEDSYLLREPAWYVSSVLKHSHSSLKQGYPISSMDSPGFRGTCRKTLRNINLNTPFETLPSKVLHEGYFIDKDQAELLSNQLSISKFNIIPAGVFLDAGALIPNFDIFIRINPGKLVLYYDQIGILKHAQISIGNGRFASMGNSFFDPRLSDRPAILTAEELGEFYGNTLRLKHNDMALTVISGSVKGYEGASATISAPKMTLKTVAVKGNGEPALEKMLPMSREEMLLGKHWQILHVAGLKSHLQIKVHGMPFNVNHMDALEFSHVVRGLMLAKPDIYSLDQLRQIDLYSCFSGFGGKYSMAQVLANELNVKVKAYPSRISKEIEQRHPSWFHVYEPMSTHAADIKNRYVYARHNAEWQSIISMHTQLHDFVAFLARLRRTFFPSRGKRAVDAEPSFFGSAYIPNIQIELAKLILGILPFQKFISDFDIDENTTVTLSRLIREYQLEDQDADDTYLQLYFDIIFAVERFKDIGNTWLRFSRR